MLIKRIVFIFFLKQTKIEIGLIYTHVLFCETLLLFINCLSKNDDDY
jgi:hypothetical protein